MPETGQAEVSAFQIKGGLSIGGLWWAALRLGLFACSAGTVTGFLGEIWWGFDLTAHFRVQYAAALFLLGIIFYLRKRIQPAAVSATFLLANLVVVLPYIPWQPAPGVQTTPFIRAVAINVYSGNRKVEAVKSFIRSSQADLVLLQEVTPEWIERLADVRKEYPYSVIEPRDNNFGIALFSKLRLEEPRVFYLAGIEAPSILTKVQSREKSFLFFGTHLVPPGGGVYSALRNKQLAAIPALTKEQKLPILLMGDLNITPWSPLFQKLIERSGLVDSSRRFGIQPTWPAQLLPLRIPIDHCLHSSALSLLRKEVGSEIGSDHFPVSVDFEILGHH